MELEVQNEQELEDLRLCVKLCYGATFTHDEGRKLDKATRTRLALLAARHDIQIESCVDVCMKSFGEDLNFEKALTCLDEVPAELRGRKKNMASLRRDVIRDLGWRITFLVEEERAEEHRNVEEEEEEEEEEGEVEAVTGGEEEDGAGTEGEEEDDDDDNEEDIVGGVNPEGAQ